MDDESELIENLEKVKKVVSKAVREENADVIIRYADECFEKMRATNIHDKAVCANWMVAHCALSEISKALVEHDAYMLLHRLMTEMPYIDFKTMPAYEDKSLLGLAKEKNSKNVLQVLQQFRIPEPAAKGLENTGTPLHIIEIRSQTDEEALATLANLRQGCNDAAVLRQYWECLREIMLVCLHEGKKEMLGRMLESHSEIDPGFIKKLRDIAVESEHFEIAALLRDYINTNAPGTPPSPELVVP